MALFVPHWGNFNNYSRIYSAEKMQKLNEIKRNKEIKYTHYLHNWIHECLYIIFFIAPVVKCSKVLTETLLFAAHLTLSHGTLVRRSPVVENHCCSDHQIKLNGREQVWYRPLRHQKSLKVLVCLELAELLDSSPHPLCVRYPFFGFPCFSLKRVSLVWFRVNPNFSLVIQLIQFILIATPRWIIHIFLRGSIDEWVWGWQKDLMHRAWLSYDTIQTAHGSTLTHAHTTRSYCAWQNCVVVFFWGGLRLMVLGYLPWLLWVAIT